VLFILFSVINNIIVVAMITIKDAFFLGFLKDSIKTPAYNRVNTLQNTCKSVFPNTLNKVIKYTIIMYM